MRPVDDSVIYRDMCLMLCWLADAPVKESVVRRILARGSRAYYHDATFMFARLLEDGVLLTKPDEDGSLQGLGWHFPPVPWWLEINRVAVADHVRGFEYRDDQRRCVRDVWRSLLQEENHDSGVAWVLPHLSQYYAQSSLGNPRQRLTKADLLLHLQAYELCAVQGDLVAAKRYQDELVGSQETLANLWEPRFDCWLVFSSALLAVREKNWAKARDHLTQVFDLWVDSQAQFLQEKDRASFHIYVANAGTTEFEQYLESSGRWESGLRLFFRFNDVGPTERLLQRMKMSEVPGL